MTIIAYRDGILAADTFVWSGSITIGTTTKIIKAPDGWMAGTAGDSYAGECFRRWVMNRRTPEWSNDIENFTGLLIDPNGNVLSYDSKYKGPSHAIASFYAIGSGYEVAIGAMSAGASAEEAARIAIERCSHCGGMIDVLKLTE